MNRRGFLFGAGALLAAPSIVRVASLMPLSVLDPPGWHRYPNGMLIIDDPHADFSTEDLRFKVTVRFILDRANWHIVHGTPGLREYYQNPYALTDKWVLDEGVLAGYFSGRRVGS